MRNLLRPNNCGAYFSFAIQVGCRIGPSLSIHPKLLLVDRLSRCQTLDGTKGVDGDNHWAHNLVYISCTCIPSIAHHFPRSERGAISFLLLACPTIYSHKQILFSSVVILSITMDSKVGTTAHIDTSVPEYDLGLSSADDAAALGMLIITCQGPRLTFNHSETRLQAGVASKFPQARSFCNCVQYYRAFAFNCLHSRLFHSCWARWNGLGPSRQT